MPLFGTLFYIFIGVKHICCRPLYIIEGHKVPRTGPRHKSAYSLNVLLYID